MTDTIRRRPDGSIDTAPYMARGRTHRSQAAHDIAGIATRRARRPLLSLAALLALLPFFGSHG